uniref:Toxin n=1 Tax=uncultured Thiotrichaceae bacterium TaxID=298394 RepID=A0A6S6U365_9GAMM|nr:MAG: Toxin [uncultured Thiotrichaceae bacterium]
MTNYQLSNAAQNDLEDIFFYGMELFGIEGALRYKDGITAQFERMAESPLLYKKLDEPLQQYRQSTYKSHSIYYLIEENRIFIVRILRSQDRDNLLMH